MRRMVPGLVICAAIITVGSGLIVFSGRAASGIWDVVFIVSAMAFLVLFITLLQSKAAATMAEHVGRDSARRPPSAG